MLTRFNDTVTIYHKVIIDDSEAWERQILHGVQWSDNYTMENQSGKMSIAKYGSITFPNLTYKTLHLDLRTEADAIFYGELDEVITTVKGHRLSDMLEKYPRSGRVKTINDNTNRTFLKNVKVVVV